MLPAAVLLQLAAACAPSVAPQTLLAVARAESGLRPLAVHDNTTGLSYAPASAAEAVALVGRLGGHSLDLGLVQVNAATLGGLGLSVRDAFDPCRSLAAGAEVLHRSYRLSLPGQPPQRALRLALSRYNTGDPARGFRNGYVGRIERAAGGEVTGQSRGGQGGPVRDGHTGAQVFRGRTEAVGAP